MHKGKSSNKIEIDGGGSDFDIASKFALHFQQVCMPNSAAFDTCMKEKFKVQFACYSGDTLSDDQLSVSAEAVCLAVLKLNKGKAPGLDGIMIEHILNCHPIHLFVVGQTIHIYAHYRGYTI